MVSWYIKSKLNVKPRAEFAEEKRQLIGRLLSHKDKKQINWMMEGVAAKRLFQKIPNPEFWEQIIPPFEIDSLLVLDCEWGKQWIKESLNLWELTNKSKVNLPELSETKLGNDHPEYIKRSINLKEFLK